MTQELNYTCPKCGNTQCNVGEFRATGGFLSKIFDVQSKTLYNRNVHKVPIY